MGLKHSNSGQGLMDLWPGCNLLGISSCGELRDSCSDMLSCGLMLPSHSSLVENSTGNKLLLGELPASLSSSFLGFVLPFSVCSA